MRKLILTLSLILFLILFLNPSNAIAELSLPGFFGDHMVVQRERMVGVWGKAGAGDIVSVAFKGSTATATADASGRWRVLIPSGVADATGAELTFTSGQDTVTIRDVLVGEVWFASGQSNMVFSMDRVPAYADIVAESDYPSIRMFNAPTVTAVEPQDDIAGEWTLCSPQTVPRYSAVAFFFARKLHTELNVPIGVIKSAWGGKPVETFTSREALNALAGTKVLVDAALKDDKAFDPQRAKVAFEARLKQWQTADAAWRTKPATERGRRPRRPQPPKRALDTEGKPGVLFNSMIHPFVGYNIRGAIWYQGEANAKPGAVPYDQTLPLLINDWRGRWKDEFSFYFVQLANFRAPSTEPGNTDPWPLLQDRMRRVLKTTSKTGMAVINDIGEADDIHPKNKLDVGERLALWALAKDYGRNLVYSGPLYKSSTVEEGVVHVKFEHVGSGLKSRDGSELKRFEIAGQDKRWHWADARITSSDTVTVSSSDVNDPVAVRYAWASNPEGANLVNSAGLPASVFRTDEWNDVVAKVGRTSQQRLEERRSLALEIKAIRAKKTELKRGSEEFNTLAEEQRKLAEKLRALTPKLNAKP